MTNFFLVCVKESEYSDSSVKKLAALLQNKIADAALADCLILYAPHTRNDSKIAQNAERLGDLLSIAVDHDPVVWLKADYNPKDIISEFEAFTPNRQNIIFVASTAPFAAIATKGGQAIVNSNPYDMICMVPANEKSIYPYNMEVISLPKPSGPAPA